MSDISKNIKQLRIKKGLNQEQLSAMIGVTRQTISNWERGVSLPDIDSIVKIAAALGVGAEELLYAKSDRLGSRGVFRPFNASFILGTFLLYPIFFLIGYQIIHLIFSPTVQQDYLYAILWAVHLLAVYVALCFCILSDKLRSAYDAPGNGENCDTDSTKKPG